MGGTWETPQRNLCYPPTELPDVQKDLVTEDKESHDMVRKDSGLKYELEMKSFRIAIPGGFVVALLLTLSAIRTMHCSL